MACAKHPTKRPVRKTRSNLQRGVQFTNISSDEDNITEKQPQIPTTSNQRKNQPRAKAKKISFINAAKIRKKRTSSNKMRHPSRGKEFSFDENITAAQDPEFNITNQTVEVIGSTATIKKLYIRGQWTKADMKNALRDVEENGMSTRKAATKWGIPCTNVIDWLYGKRTTKKKGPPTILTDEEEKEIVAWCKDMAELGHGLDTTRLWVIQAFQLALTPENIKVGFQRTGIWPLDENSLSNDMRPSEAFDVEEDEVAAIENILRMARVEEADVQCCLEELAKNVEAVDIDDSLILPTQFSAPQWIKEGAANLGMQIDFNNEEVSTSMPSPLSSLPSEVVHYYADTLAWEDHDANQIYSMNSNTHGLDKENFEDGEFLATQENQEVNCTQDENNQAYKLMEVVKMLNMRVSAFGMRVQIGLEEKGVKYEYQEENIAGNKSELLLRMNPVHKMIPVLIRNGNPICESLIILQYIDKAWPTSMQFLPSDPYDRELARFWADFVDKKIYEAGSRIIRFEGEDQEAAKCDMLEGLECLEGALKQMSKGGHYIGGEEFGFLDIAFISFVPWFHTYESIGNFKSPLETRFPLLHAWIGKCMERESVKKASPPPERVLEFALQIRKKTVVD
ncbi:hypothetical protein KI387_034336 [Taxus chinensis]|uniref:glutathione transferase n=1 Tax=Taxus chinensis TaxID=29808 RepID=A0AA38C367_TAXCH|nr:hypothetical protein KI387_034336 [Taxus chinensis]